jgi:hypothetical protein
MFCSIHGFYPLNARSTSALSYDNKKTLPNIPKGRAKSPLAEKHLSKVIWFSSRTGILIQVGLTPKTKILPSHQGIILDRWESEKRSQMGS